MIKYCRTCQAYTEHRFGGIQVLIKRFKLWICCECDDSQLEPMEE